MPYRQPNELENNREERAEGERNQLAPYNEAVGAAEQVAARVVVRLREIVNVLARERDEMRIAVAERRWVNNIERHDANVVVGHPNASAPTSNQPGILIYTLTVHAKYGFII